MNDSKNIFSFSFIVFGNFYLNFTLINEINSLLNETKVGKKTSLNQLVAINKKISIREELINTIMAEIHQLNRGIKQNEKEINKLKENLAK